MTPEESRQLAAAATTALGSSLLLCKVHMLIILAAHAAAHKFMWSSPATVLCVLAFLWCCRPILCRHPEAAGVPRESKYGYGVGAALRPRSVGDLLAIKGIRPKRMEKMRKYITVGKSVAPKKQAGSVATSSTLPTNSKSPTRAAPKNLKAKPCYVEPKPNKFKRSPT